MYLKSNKGNIYSALRRLPDAVAVLMGREENIALHGTVKFYQTSSGVFVVADVSGLPRSNGACNSRIFAFHIHDGQGCDGNEADPFANAGSHYNPDGCPHPYHRGDMPPLFSAGGRALLAFLTDRFTADEILGKTVIIHDSPDDFTTQPGGNAGNKIACGTISKVMR